VISPPSRPQGGGLSGFAGEARRSRGPIGGPD
jgi:hypothetical protein